MTIDEMKRTQERVMVERERRLVQVPPCLCSNFFNMHCFLLLLGVSYDISMSVFPRWKWTERKKRLRRERPRS